METKYQEIFMELTSNEMLESICPTDINSKLQFKNQIQDLFENLDGKGIKKGHENDYKYNIEKNKDLIVNILSFDNNLQGKAKENFEKVKYSLLGVLMNKYDKICEAKNIVINLEHSEKHGEDFLKFIKSVFNINLIKDNFKYIPDIKNRNNLYFFIKNATILDSGKQITKFTNQEDIVFKSDGRQMEVPSLIKRTIDSILLLNNESRGLENINENDLKELQQLFFKTIELLLTKNLDNLEKELLDTKQKIENKVSQHHLLQDRYRKFKTQIFTEFNLKDKSENGAIIDDNNISIFIATTIDLDEKQQGRPNYMHLLEKNNISETTKKRFTEEISIDSIFSWTNDAETSNLVDINKNNVIYKQVQSGEKTTITIDIINFLKNEAIFSKQGRPATNFFALIQTSTKNKENEQIIDELIKNKLECLARKIEELSNNISSKNEKELEKILLPFCAMVLYKEDNGKDFNLNANMDINSFFVKYDTLIKNFPIIEQEANKLLKKYKLLEKQKSTKNNVDNSKLASTGISSDSTSNSSARSDSISSINSVEVEDLPSEEEDLDIIDLKNKSIEELQQLQTELLEKNKKLYSQMYDNNNELIKGGKNTSKEIKKNKDLFDEITNIINIKQQDIEIEDLPLEEDLITDLENRSVEELEKLREYLVEKNKSLRNMAFDIENNFIEGHKNEAKKIGENYELFNKITSVINNKEQQPIPAPQRFSNSKNKISFGSMSEKLLNSRSSSELSQSFEKSSK